MALEPTANRSERTGRPAALWRDIKRSRNAYLFIAPFYAVFIVFMLFPICFSLYLSFYRWNGIMAPQGVGLSNYLQALRDENLHSALANSTIFTVLTVGAASILGLGLAIFLNSVRFLKHFYRGVFFVPTIVSLVVVSLVWKLILNSEVGLLNGAIHAVGDAFGYLGFAQPYWTLQQYRFLDSPDRFVPLLTITFVNVWAAIGFATVIYLAGLQGIPAHLYEVSRMDGATPLQNFVYITLPLLQPTTFFVVFILTIDALQVFVLPNVMNRDSESTMTVVYYLYRNAFEFYKMGYASAIAYLLFGITVALSAAIRLTLGREARFTDPE